MKNQTWLVAKNIYRNRVKGFGFWALVLSPFILAAVSLIIGFIVSSGGSETPHLAVVGQPALTQVLKENKTLDVSLSNTTSHAQAEKKLDSGDIDGFLMVENGAYTLVTSSRSAVKFDQNTFQAALTQVNLGQTAQKLGLSGSEVAELLTPAKLEMKTQTAAGRTAGGDSRASANVAVGTIASVVIFILLMMYVGIIGQEIGNEKSSRIMETLLATTSSNVQYYGKIIGVIMLAATQIGLYVVGFGLAYPFIREQAVVKQMAEMLSGITFGFAIYLIFMAIFGILGYLILASIVASLVNEQAQVQQATQPIAFLSMVGYIGGIAGAAVPGNVILKILSFIPFISPTLMTSRFAIQYSTSSEAWVAVLLQILATVLVAKAGEKIYARNVLSYSDEKILRQLLRNITGKDKMPKSKNLVSLGRRKIQPWRIVLAVIIVLAVLIYRFFINK